MIGSSWNMSICCPKNTPRCWMILQILCCASTSPVCKKLTGTAGLAFRPTIVLSTNFLSPLYNPSMVETMQTLAEIGLEDAKAGAASAKYASLLAEMGFPGAFTGAAEAPYDILSDYFRTTVGTVASFSGNLSIVDHGIWHTGTGCRSDKTATGHLRPGGYLLDFDGSLEMPNQKI